MTLGISRWGGLFVVVQNVAVVMNATTQISDQNWHHVVLTRDSSNSWSIYIDGTKDKEVTHVAVPVPNDRPLGIGAEYVDNVSTVWPFTGSIDETIIFNKSLNSTQVDLLYKSYP